MIIDFGDKDTEELFKKRKSRHFGDVTERALAKLDQLHAATTLADMRVPPGNRLHGLSGELSSYHAVSVSKGWRMIFIWTAAGAIDVSIDNHYGD